VYRGGSWFYPAVDCRSAARIRDWPSFRFYSFSFGFRVSLSASGK